MDDTKPDGPKTGEDGAERDEPMYTNQRMMQIVRIASLRVLRDFFGEDSDLVAEATKSLLGHWEGIEAHTLTELLAKHERMSPEKARELADALFGKQETRLALPETHYWPPRAANLMNPFPGHRSFFDPLLVGGMGSPRPFADGRIDPPTILRTPESLRIQGGVGSSVFEGLDLSGYLAALARVARKKLDQPVDYQADNDPANKLIISMPALAFSDITVATRVALALEGKCGVSEAQCNLPAMKITVCGNQMYPHDVRSAINDLGYTCTISSTIRVHLAMVQGDQWVEIPADRPRLSILKLEQHPAFWQNYHMITFWRDDSQIGVMDELFDGDKITLMKEKQT